jgi:hypothetical protein
MSYLNGGRQPILRILEVACLQSYGAIDTQSHWKGSVLEKITFFQDKEGGVILLATFCSCTKVRLPCKTTILPWMSQLQEKSQVQMITNGDRFLGLEHSVMYVIVKRLVLVSFSQVVLAKEKATGKEYAIKKMLKSFLSQDRNKKFVMNERNVLSKCDHPNIVKLYQAFRDDEFFYYVLNLAPNGELLGAIRKVGSLLCSPGSPF